MAASIRVAAVDLGGSSGRVATFAVSPDEIRIERISRIPNVPVESDGELCWNLLRLEADIMAHLADAAERPLHSIGVDAWSSDYALLRDGDAARLPRHQRSPRTLPYLAAASAAVGEREMWRRSRARSEQRGCERPSAASA